MDPALFGPWITEADRHVQEHPKAYLSMPKRFFEAMLKVRAKEEAEAHEGYVAEDLFVSQWLHDAGRPAYVAQAHALDESHTEDLESLLASILVPTLIISGAENTQEPDSPASRLKDTIPGVSLGRIPWAQHLLTEHLPDDVGHALGCFFAVPGSD